MSLQDNHTVGPQSAIDNNRLDQLLEHNSGIAVRKLAEDFDASRSTVHNHLETVGKVKKLDRWVLHEFMQTKDVVCKSLLIKQRNKNFLDRVITYDEKWILYNNRHHSAQWLHKAPKHTSKPALHLPKTMVIV
ncbi:putative SET domain and mariner transposase fusion protein [Trypoxylus dichotomus]